MRPTVLVTSAAAAFVAFAIVTVTPEAVDAGQRKKGDPTRDLYVAHCQMCHGVDGAAPAKEMGFVGRKWKTKTTAQAIEVITNGVPGTAMVGFEGTLTKEQIAALAKYVRALDSPARKKK